MEDSDLHPDRTCSGLSYRVPEECECGSEEFSQHHIGNMMVSECDECGDKYYTV